MEDAEGGGKGRGVQLLHVTALLFFFCLVIIIKPRVSISIELQPDPVWWERDDLLPFDAKGKK